MKRTYGVFEFLCLECGAEGTFNSTMRLNRKPGVVDKCPNCLCFTLTVDLVDIREGEYSWT